MTIASDVRRAGPFIGNGAQTDFQFDFKVFEKTDIAVYLRDADAGESVLVLDWHYSATLNVDQDNNPGGTITYPIVGTPLASTQRLVVIGALPQVQLTDITNAGGFYPEVIENALDYLTILIQQLTEQIGRAVIVPVTHPGAGSPIELPDPEPFKLLGWHATLPRIVNYDPAGGITVIQGSVPDYLLQNIGVS